MQSYVAPLLILACLYIGVGAALVLLGRRTDARALAGFIPDCIVFFSRLAADGATPRRKRWTMVGLLAYLSSPIDLIPDFIPVLGQLDDAIVARLVLRWVARDRSPAELRRFWPGPSQSFALVLKFAGVAAGQDFGPRRDLAPHEPAGASTDSPDGDR
ncbi:MAG: hypothetical protein QOJ38_169 [Solirubrobacterales bacterium]|jgi:uncharacterized membrane protein YkvA (DUF1232 family)|nr:hypothetical protein [Solirubrobacterales bacterium]